MGSMVVRIWLFIAFIAAIPTAFTADYSVVSTTKIMTVSLQHAIPTVVDWDNDGKKDLLLGCWLGKVYFYKNIGTDAAPAFSATGAVVNGITAPNY